MPNWEINTNREGGAPQLKAARPPCFYLGREAQKEHGHLSDSDLH